MADNGQMASVGTNLAEYSHATKAARGPWMGGKESGIDIAVVKGRRTKEGRGKAIGDYGI